MANTQKTIAEIMQSAKLTPYEVFRLLQTAVATVDEVRASELKPQPVYNYDRNGLIVKGYNHKVRGNVAGRYTVAEAAAWIAKWTNKHLGQEVNILAPAPKQNKDTAMMQSAARG